jgi:hypothetical protein
MRGSGVILGDWTHRRGDAGGTRSIFADVAKAHPEPAWSWSPEHQGRVDQVRIAGALVFVATMTPSDPEAPGWEHAVIYALKADTGEVVARRTLPDPVPVAAMLVDAGALHVIATRRDEPIFWYSLNTTGLLPNFRSMVDIDRDARREDVLDAWASPDGGVWLELEGALGSASGRAFTFVAPGNHLALTQTHEDDVVGSDWGAPARDACVSGHVLFAPLAGAWRGDGWGDPPALWKVEPKVAAASPQEGEGRPAPARTAWARTDVAGPRAHVHAMAGEGLIHALAIAQDFERTDRALVQALSVDRATEVVRTRTPVMRVALKGPLGEGARVARRSNGELLMQGMQPDGDPCSDLICARPDGEMGAISIGNGRRLLLDAALGDVVLAHGEVKGGRIAVTALEIDREGRLLGRRSVPRWAVETEDLGGDATIYAGAGHIVVRGVNGIVAIKV